ncbi:nitrile hydratase accessory protein [Brenneria rubrifaciens]
MTMHNHYEAVGLPRDEAGPVFDKPWQAQVFSLTVHLHQAGCFTWRDWVQAFSDEIKASPARPDESVNDAYYRQWTTAMEKMITSLGLTGEDDVSRRAQAWRQAYLNTPHGQPVLLAHASCPPPHGHHHDHSPHRAPVAVSRAFGG